jgi:ABC-type Fe3+-hydroxamate transport system substrate-binding protein
MNYPIMFGAATFNSTNIYPNLEAFKTIDKENKYSDIYNRYCQISVNLINKNAITNINFEKFVLLNPDHILINMTEEDLIDLGIKYILTLEDLSTFSNEKITFELLYYTSKCAIYELHYDK